MILSLFFSLHFSQAARKVPEGRTAVMLENITWQVSMESKKINITDIHRHFVENHKTRKGLQVHHLKTNVLKKGQLQEQ